MSKKWKRLNSTLVNSEARVFERAVMPFIRSEIYNENKNHAFDDQFFVSAYLASLRLDK
jgi:hypothetical protein